MKRMIIMMCLFFGLVVSTGCEKEESVKRQEIVSDSVKPALSKLVPDPETMFSNLEFEVTDPESGDTYQFILKGATQEDFEMYVDACRDAIFTEENCDLSTSYQAYSSDRQYWLSLSYFPGNENAESYIYVDVRDIAEKEKIDYVK